MAKVEVNFTKQAIELFPSPAPGKRLEVYDTKIPGLLMRITDRGTKTFTVYGRVNGGNPTRVNVGRYPNMSIEQARKKALDYLGMMANGTNPNTEKKAARAKGMTLQEVLDNYLTDRDLKPRTIKDYREVTAEVFPDWLDRPILNLTKDMIGARHRKHGERSKARANNAMRVLRALFNYAAAKYEDENGEPLIKDNPVKRISDTRSWYRVRRRQTYIKPHDLPAWFSAVMDLPVERERDYFLTMLFTGLRSGEAARLEKAKIDLRDRTFTIYDTKNHEDHTLPLSNFIFEILEARIDSGNSKYIFPADSQSGHLVDARKSINKVIEASGVSFCNHDLRRTFTTIAEGLDISAYAVKRLLNHKMPNDVTAGYVVKDVNRLRAPMQSIEDFILSATKVRPKAKVIALEGQSG